MSAVIHHVIIQYHMMFYIDQLSSFYKIVIDRLDLIQIKLTKMINRKSRKYFQQYLAKSIKICDISFIP